MNVAVFSSKPYDRRFLTAANEAFRHDLVFFEARLKAMTAALARGFSVVCPFVNDDLDRPTIDALAGYGVKLIALRCAGFNNVDLCAAYERGIRVARVPAYSPYSVAEHAAALLLALVRRLPQAYNRVREGNFALEGLLGFELHGKTVGVIGTGRIGVCFARIMSGFGARVIAYDPKPDPECLALGVVYHGLEDVLRRADIISLHVPLIPATRHLIDGRAIALTKPGVVMINTSRGGLIDTLAVISGLKTGRIGALGLDVYEEEGNLFFEDLSGRVIQDDVFARLQTFPNVLITGHQGFFTDTALTSIAHTTLQNIADFSRGVLNAANEVTCERLDRSRHCDHPCGKPEA